MTLKIVNVPPAGRTTVKIPLPTGARLISFYVQAGTCTWRVYDAVGNWVYVAGTSRGTTLAGESWRFGEGMSIEASSITNVTAANVVQIVYDDRDVGIRD